MSLSLSKIIAEIRPRSVIGFDERNIEGVAIHPKHAKDGFLFACIDEYIEYNRWMTHRSFHEQIPSLPISAVLLPEPIVGLKVPQLIVDHPREDLAVIAQMLAGRPNADIELIGVTGTNGKTTTTRMVASLLKSIGKKCASLGTLGLAIDGKTIEAGSYTTPLAPELMRVLSMLKATRVNTLAMEVSSHALELGRVFNLEFDGAILTQITRDHLDFHGTESAYLSAKLKLFQQIQPDGIACINAGSKCSRQFCEASNSRIVTYGFENADYCAQRLEVTPNGTRFDLSIRGKLASKGIYCPLIGRFQVENLLASLAYLTEKGYDLDKLESSVTTIEPVPGRMERYQLKRGAVAIIDYAHNPDGLRNLLENCRMLNPQKVHVVFGCGGDRDRGKRPLMGAIANELADYLWVTSDNPRTEDPQLIIDEILQGIPSRKKCQVNPDRKEAISMACESATDGDIVVIAGKGHEDYQIIGTTKYPYRDQEVIQPWIEGE